MLVTPGDRVKSLRWKLSALVTPSTALTSSRRQGEVASLETLKYVTQSLLLSHSPGDRVKSLRWKLRQPLLGLHPQLQEVVETVHLPAAQAYKERPLRYRFDSPENNNNEMMQELEQRLDAIYAALPENSATWTLEHSQMYNESQRLEQLLGAL